MRLYGNFLVWKQQSLLIATGRFGTFCPRPRADVFGRCARQRVNSAHLSVSGVHVKYKSNQPITRYIKWDVHVDFGYLLPF